MVRFNRRTHLLAVVLLSAVACMGFSHTVENVPSYCQLYGGW